MSILLRSPLVRSRLLNMGMAGGAPAGYSTEAQQFFDRITDPGATRKGYLATLIDGLVADSLWSKIDALWMFAQDISGNAVVNLKSSSFTASLVNSPTFAADEGYTGNGSTSYVNTTFVPSSAGGSFALNAAAFGLYIRTARGSNAAYQAFGSENAGGQSYLLVRWSDGAHYYAINGGNSTRAGYTTTQGMWVVSRTSSTNRKEYLNGAVDHTGTGTATSLPTVAQYIAARNNNGSADRHSTDQMAAGFISGALDDTEAANVSSRINAYMTSLGKNVY